MYIPGITYADSWEDLHLMWLIENHPEEYLRLLQALYLANMWDLQITKDEHDNLVILDELEKIATGARDWDSTYSMLIVDPDTGNTILRQIIDELNTYDIVDPQMEKVIAASRKQMKEVVSNVFEKYSVSKNELVELVKKYPDKVWIPYLHDVLDRQSATEAIANMSSEDIVYFFDLAENPVIRSNDINLQQVDMVYNRMADIILNAVSWKDIMLELSDKTLLAYYLIKREPRLIKNLSDNRVRKAVDLLVYAYKYAPDNKKVFQYIAQWFAQHPRAWKSLTSKIKNSDDKELYLFKQSLLQEILNNPQIIKKMTAKQLIALGTHLLEGGKLSPKHNYIEMFIDALKNADKKTAQEVINTLNKNIIPTMRKFANKNKTYMNRLTQWNNVVKMQKTSTKPRNNRFR